MRMALPLFCLLAAPWVAVSALGAEPGARTDGETRVAHLVRGMAHRSEPIVAEAQRRYADAPDADKRVPLEAALAARLPKAVRAFCVRELGRLADGRSAPVLLKTAVRDAEASIRSAAVRALRGIDAPNKVAHLARALRSRRTSDRVHAAHALGELGDITAAPHVLYRWSARSGDFPRGYFAQTKQLSYVGDFDVEVA